MDWHFPSGELEWDSIEQKLISIPGVVETGLFINMAQKVFFGMPDGSVKVQE